MSVSSVLGSVDLDDVLYWLSAHGTDPTTSPLPLLQGALKTNSSTLRGG